MDARLYRDFARLEDRHWWFRGRRAVVQAVLRARFKRPSLRILDVGCGTGGMMMMLTEFGRVEGLDVSAEGLAFCRDRVGPQVELHQGSLPAGIPEGRRYGLVTAFDVLEHLDDPVGALRAIAAALEPGGTFVCTVPAHPSLWSRHDVANHHARRYTRPLLEQHLVAGGLTPTQVSFLNASLLAPIALVRWAQRLFPGTADPGGEVESDFAEVPAVLNRLLEALFSVERFVVPSVGLPFGVSLLAVAEAPVSFRASPTGGG